MIQVDIKCVFVTDGTRLLADGFQIVLFVLIHDQRDIFNGGEYVNELEMLMNHADAQGIGVLRAANLTRLFIDQKLTAVRIVYTGDHVHQRRFAAAVFAQQGENFSSADGQ